MSDFSFHTYNPSGEKNRLLRSMVIPVIFVLIMWLVKSIEIFFDLNFSHFGILPLKARGILGIVTAPFIHGDLKHLFNNSIPILVLGSTLFYFYREVAKNVLALSIFITGIWVWVFAREAWHIGASGVVYSLAAFLFTSGVIRRHPRLMAISLLVTFLYGSLVWGILPIQDRVSWESHLMGLVSGVLLAYHFRSFGPQRKKYEWEMEEDEEPGEIIPQDDFAERVIRSIEKDPAIPSDDPDEPPSGPNIKYHFKPKDKPDEEKE